jgi:hypothetical protein
MIRKIKNTSKPRLQTTQASGILYIQDMPNENNDLSNIDLDALVNNMSSINSEDYWFTKVGKIEEHDESTSEKPDSNKAQY